MSAIRASIVRTSGAALAASGVALRLPGVPIEAVK